MHRCNISGIVSSNILFEINIFLFYIRNVMTYNKQTRNGHVSQHFDIKTHHFSMTTDFFYWNYLHWRAECKALVDWLQMSSSAHHFTAYVYPTYNPWSGQFISKFLGGRTLWRPISRPCCVVQEWKLHFPKEKWTTKTAMPRTEL